MSARRGGRVAGSEGYSKADIQALLKCVREFLPKYPRDWETVLDLYREIHARPSGRSERDVMSLKKKFRGILTSKKLAGALNLELEEAHAIQRLIDDKDDENAETVAPHEFKILERRYSETAACDDSDDSSQSRKDDEATEVETEPRAPAPEHSMIQPVDSPEVQVVSEAPSSTTLVSEISVTRSTQHTRNVPDEAAPEVARKRRKALVDLALDDLEAQALAPGKDVTSTEGFLRWHLASETAERRRLQRQVEDLRDRMDDLRDDHRAELESVRGSLLDKMETLREKNLSLAMENSRIQAEIIALRAVQRPAAK